MENEVLLSSVAAAAVATYLFPTACAYSSAAPIIRAYRHLIDPKRIALTFDDGPHPEGTPRILEALNNMEVHATFFVVGSDAEKHPEIVQQINAAGHEIQNHGYRHRNHYFRNPLGLARDIRRGADVLESITGSRPTLYRPPQGAVTPITRWASWHNRLPMVLWSTWGRDWRGGATAKTVHHDVCRRLSGGGIVLLHDSDAYAAHDSWKTTIAALPRIVETIRNRDLTLCALSGKAALRW